MTESKYILSIDQGTSSSRAIVFDRKGDVQALFQKELELLYPNKGWVEQPPMDIVEDTIWALQSICEGRADLVEGVCAAGLSNQRETVIIWDRHTGEPVYNAIVWQDRRTAHYCEELKQQNAFEKEIQERTGLLLDPYFSATKIKWVLDHVEGVRERAEAGELIFGTVDCFLLWHLTKGASHKTDATNASRTMLYNINECEWDNFLFDSFDIPYSMAPEVCDNIHDFGVINVGCALDGTKILGLAGDQQSALIGQGCVEKGMVKSTYGTGCFILTNIGHSWSCSKNKMLNTVAYSIDGEVTYAIEGSVFNAGTAIQFLRDNFTFFEKARQTTSMADSLADNGGVYFVPAFTGMGAPYWDADATGTITGLKRNTSKEHIVRAALEAQAYQTRDLIGAMEEDSGIKISTLRADGGLTANHFMCQFLADQLSVAIEVPKVLEATAWGAAILAGIGCGLFDSLKDAASMWRCSERFDVQMDSQHANELYDGWQNVVQRNIGVKPE